MYIIRYSQISTTCTFRDGLKLMYFLFTYIASSVVLSRDENKIQVFGSLAVLIETRLCYLMWAIIEYLGTSYCINIL